VRALPEYVRARRPVHICVPRTDTVARSVTGAAYLATQLNVHVRAYDLWLSGRTDQHPKQRIPAN
jgi:hypothetical protein